MKRTIGNAAQPTVTIILVTWNSATCIGSALESVIRQSYPASSLRVVVVDNASRDRTVTIVRERFPDVCLIQQKTNRGFAVANNAAMRRYPADYFVLLNPDVALESSWLSRIIEAMESDPGIGVAGGKVFYGDKVLLQHVGGMIRGNALTYHLGSGERDMGQYEQGANVDYIMGAALATRGDLAQAQGYLPEAYFLYFEETEYCLKVRKVGCRVVYIPGAVAYHDQVPDDSRAQDWRFAWKYHRARYLFVLRNTNTQEERDRFREAERTWRCENMPGNVRRLYLLSAKLVHWRLLFRNRWLLAA
jgi:GT2 family glycosyltransferase